MPQIEINSPSPNSPVATMVAAEPAAITSKSKTGVREQCEQRFGYDSYMKSQDESPPPSQAPVPMVSHVKSPNSQRKSSKTSTTISPIKSRDHSDSKRSSNTPINGNPNINKTKMMSPRHTSTSSEEQQHAAPPTPMKPAKIPEQQLAPPAAPLSNSGLMNKPNQPARLFIALFDYDPNAMSPNKDNDEELPFKEGQLIKVCFCIFS